VYKGVLDNGNFREFLHGAGGFSTLKRDYPVALVGSDDRTTELKRNAGIIAVKTVNILTPFCQ